MWTIAGKRIDLSRKIKLAPLACVLTCVASRHTLMALAGASRWQNMVRPLMVLTLVNFSISSCKITRKMRAMREMLLQVLLWPAGGAQIHSYEHLMMPMLWAFISQTPNVKTYKSKARCSDLRFVSKAFNLRGKETRNSKHIPLMSFKDFSQSHQIWIIIHYRSYLIGKLLDVLKGQTSKGILMLLQHNSCLFFSSHRLCFQIKIPPRSRDRL